ncbi:hypothetical protein SAMN05518872_104311 [Psychrobacillus sp. OK032]|nr:hypothetical protein SAMN05518872_104311 [Psychrobacillus sp. OK032]
MNITIRKEQTEEYIITEHVVKNAFASMELSNKKEYEVVARIRKSDVSVSVPELSLVAINENINLTRWPYPSI